MLIHFRPTDPFFLYGDLDNATQGMPQLYADLSKNATVPNVNGAVLWEDSVNKRLYMYGGEYYQTEPASFNLYSYDILLDHWISYGPGTGSPIVPTSYGAGVSISSRGEGYHYGGWFSEASVPGWKGPPKASNRLIKYTMESNRWDNLTGPPDNIPRAEGTMLFIPAGDVGMLVYFGGGRDVYNNGTLAPEPLDTIYLYDIGGSKWYTQKTTGRTPENRRLFCGGATWVDDQSSYNM